MPSYTFTAYHPVQRTRIASLDLRDPVWTEVVNSGSTLSAKITVPDNLNKIEEIRTATRPWQSAVFVDCGLGRLVWGGIVTNRKWNSESNELSITVTEWRTWLYDVVIGPKLNGSAGNVWNYVDVDQLDIVRNILGILLAEGTAGGVPPITYGTELSGVLRNLTILGTSFDTAGKLIDSIANQDNGFEWDLEPYYANDGKPTLRMQMYVPTRGGPIPGLSFARTPSHGNLTSVDDLEENADNIAVRVWATGEGPNAESLPFAQDSDPGLSTGQILRRDQVTNYSGEVAIRTLAALARAEREFRSEPFGTLTVTVRLDAPDINSYGKGDRARLRLVDRFKSLDIDRVRILSREIHPQENLAKLVLDLNDTGLAEFDDEGAV